MFKRMTSRIAWRAIAMLSFGLLFGLSLTSPSAWAIQAPLAGSTNPPKAGLVVQAPEFDVQPSTQAAQGLGQISGSNPAAARFLNRYPGDWTITWDRRNDRPNMIMGRGIPLIPGRGNGLTRADVGLSGNETMDLATVGVLLEDFISKNADLLRIDGLDFRVDTRSLDPFGPDRNHWFVEYQQVKDGVPVTGAHLFFRIAAGNIVQFGTYMAAPVTIDTRPAANASDTFALAFAQMDFPAGTQVMDWLERGSLEIRPYMPDGAAMRGEPFRGTPGSGYAHRLLWRFVIRVDNDRTTYQILVDAKTNQVIDVRDLNMYATATVDGGVYPSGARNIPGTAITVPFPYVNVSNGGTKTTDASGNYNYGSGTASTTLNGKYINISDTCGNPSLSASSPGDLHLGTSGGTDCTKPANNSSTHSARNAFYYLTEINRKAATYYPSNVWLNGTVTANVNIDDVCNAYWDGSTLNFFKSGSYGGTQCANTGELSGVFMHEFGHGIQAKIGGSPNDMGTGEATGDTFAFLQTHDSCIGDGFIVNSGASCTGVRDVGEFALHGPGSFVVTPANITASAGPDCDNDMACPYFTPQGYAYQGPMGYEGHCESYIASSANWDLAQELVGALGGNAGWQKMDDLWYAILPQNKAAYRVESGGKCNTGAVVNGCGSNNWYNLYLAADDDDGNLANGTPNACRIWDAFNAHGIACGARPVCSTATPDFDLSLTPTTGGICAPGNVAYTVNTVALGNPPLTNPIDLSVSGLPAGVSGNFSPTPVVPGSSSTLTLNAAAGALAGSHVFTVTGNASGVGNHNTNGSLNITVGVPSAPLLSSPSDGASGVSLAATLSWASSTGASSYTVEVATDAAFNTIVNTQTGITGTSASVSLQASTTYYWRVKATGDCGDGAYSAVRSFTTGTAPFPAPYCNVTFPSGVVPITRVTFAGIDNTSSATVNGSPALEDFTAIVGNVTQGETLPISVKGNTDGNWIDKILVYVDWNQDGDFSDAGETYTLSDLSNSTGTDSKASTGNIAVPAGAPTGQTRMRVLKKFSTAGDPCTSTGYGQAEDYTLNVAAAAGNPVIAVNPSSVTASLSTNTTTTQPLTIGNTGGSDLNWSINEEPASRASNPLASKSHPTGHVSPRAPSARNATPAPLAEIMQDPSFEATTGDGSPNPYWSADDSNSPGDTVFYSASGFGIDVHTGDWEAWFGGWRATASTQWFSQAVVIPTGGPHLLTYWRNVVLAPQGSAIMTVYVDSAVVETTDMVANGVDAAWVNKSIDVSAYGDGGTHVIKFEYVIAGADDGNVFIDDVSLDAGGGGTCSSPSDVPWLTEVPVSGTTVAGGSSAVTVTFDSTGLAANTYNANLCVTSNDPVSPLVAIPVAMTVTSTPASYPITVTVTPAGGGTASCTPNPVTHGGSSSCTASANAGFTFAGWSGDCTGATCALTNVIGAGAVTATFTQNTYPITVTITPVAGGSASCSPNPVAHGGSSTCTASANLGYTFAGWSGDCAGATCVLANVDGVRAVTATFAIDSYTVTASSGGNGNITPASQPVNHGGTANFTVSPASGYHVASVNGDTCTVTGSGSSYSAANIVADCAVTATFAIDSYTVTASSGGNGNITPASQPVNHGGTANFTVSPASGYHVASVNGDTCTVTGSGSSYSAANIVANCAVTATFAIDSYTVTASSGGNGNITPASQPINHGGTANFTVSPASGYHVASVNGDTCTVTGSGSSYSAANIVADCAVTATFAIDSYTVTPSVGTGSGTISPDTPRTVTYNGTLSFTLTPGADEVIGSVGGTCGGTLTGTTYTTSPITANCTVVANFVDVAIFKDSFED